MKKKFIPRALAALPVILTCVSCAVAMEPDFSHYSTRGRSWAQRLPVNTMAVTASVEQPSDGTNTGTVKWKAGDKIRIFNTTNPEGVEFTLEEACDGLTVGTFMGEVLSGTGPFYAVYPSCVAGSLNGEEVDIVVPQKQELVSGSFGNGANIAFAKVEDLSQKFPFRNVLGAVKVSLSSHIGAACVRIETKADEALWGPATVCMAGDIPSLTFTKPQPSRQIVEASGNATGKDFYVMAPPGTLADGFILQVSDGWNDTMFKSASASENNRVVRSGVVPLPALEFAPQVQSAFLSLTPALPTNLIYGYYDGIGAGGTLVPYFTFSKATGYYANITEAGESRTFRMQDFSAGKMYQFVVPARLALGGSYDTITVESVVGSEYTAPTPFTFRLVQKTDEAGWFVSEDYSKGFIISLED